MLLSQQKVGRRAYFYTFSRKSERRITMKQHNEVPYKIYLSEDELPKAWYNVRADMKN